MALLTITLRVNLLTPPLKASIIHEVSPLHEVIMAVLGHKLCRIIDSSFVATIKWFRSLFPNLI